MSKPKVLVMVDWYAPGFKAGGPIRSVVNFADQLESDLDIYVLTTDRDLGATEPYHSIKVNQWVERGNHQVFYASPDFISWRNILDVVHGINPDIVYLNSMFSRMYTIYPLLMKRLGKIEAEIILAPRGMLKSSALEYKSLKKKIFLQIFRLLGLSKSISFQATDLIESKDISKIFGEGTRVFLTANLPGKQRPFKEPENKRAGFLKIVFVGRIHPIKNLEWLLHSMESITEQVQLTVIATLEDKGYWEKCQLQMHKLPGNISVETFFDLPNEEIEGIIQANHIFALPTRGENFGHSIFESLAAGRPVLISDQTPWRGLEIASAGWDLPLDDPQRFTEKIRMAASWDMEILRKFCRGAWEQAHGYLLQAGMKDKYLNMMKTKPELQ